MERVRVADLADDHDVRECVVFLPDGRIDLEAELHLVEVAVGFDRHAVAEELADDDVGTLELDRVGVNVRRVSFAVFPIEGPHALGVARGERLEL